MCPWQWGWSWLIGWVESLFQKELSPQFPSSSVSSFKALLGPTLAEGKQLGVRLPSRTQGLQYTCTGQVLTSPLPRFPEWAARLVPCRKMVTWSSSGESDQPRVPQFTPHWQAQLDFWSASSCPTLSCDQTLRDHQTPEESPWHKRDQSKQEWGNLRDKRIFREEKTFFKRSVI